MDGIHGMAQGGRVRTRTGRGPGIVRLLVLLMAVGAGVLVLRQFVFPAGPEFRLSDGSSARVVSVRQARHHHLPFDPLPVRLLRILPARWLGRWAPRPGAPVFQGTAPGVAVWLRYDRVPDLIRTNGGATAGGTAVLVEVHDGRRFTLRPDMETSGVLPDGGYYEGFFLPAPISDRPVTLEVRERLRTRWEEPSHAGPPLASWQRRFPGSDRTAAELQAESLPSTRSTNGLRVTLTDLTLGVVRDPGPGRAAAPGDTWIRATFDLQASDGAAWEVLGLGEYADSRGATRQRQSWSQQGGVLWWRESLWPDQPWRIRFEVGRTNGFAPGEMVRFDGLTPGVADGSFVETDAGRVAVDRFEWEDSSHGRLRFKIDSGGRRTRLRLLLAEDADGHPLDSGGSSWSAREVTFFLWRPDGTGSGDGPIRVVLAHHETRQVEFVVEPRVDPGPGSGPDLPAARTP